MTDAGLIEERTLVEPVAVGPGESPANGHAPTGDSLATTGGLAPTDALATSDAALATTDGVATTDAADGAGGLPVPAGILSPADASLLDLIDRLSAVLERGDLGELEVSSGGTTIILRAPSAIAAPLTVQTQAAPIEAQPLSDGGAAAGGVPTPAVDAPPAAKPSVKAPLTGIYYGAPSPGATAYVSVGDHVSVGQIIGLIEAMKLFNEIKSDLAGRVVRICAESGALVKAKQPLIEVEPA